jgi:hypothetical protein
MNALYKKIESAFRSFFVNQSQVRSDEYVVVLTSSGFRRVPENKSPGKKEYRKRLVEASRYLFQRNKFVLKDSVIETIKDNDDLTSALVKIRAFALECAANAKLEVDLERYLHIAALAAVRYGNEQCKS